MNIGPVSVNRPIHSWGFWAAHIVCHFMPGQPAMKMLSPEQALGNNADDYTFVYIPATDVWFR